MPIKSKNTLNTAALSKKYKCDINKLIRFWKKDKSDFEISQALGLDMLTVLQIRQEISSIHERERQRHLKNTALHKSMFTNKPR